jgi:hypothetical protein
LWQTWYEPPPVDTDVSVDFESLWELVVVAVKLAGAALIVVATPLTVERKGVMVATGFPLASTETHGSRRDSETRCSLMIRTLSPFWRKETYQLVEL